MRLLSTHQELQGHDMQTIPLYGTPMFLSEVIHCSGVSVQAFVEGLADLVQNQHPCHQRDPFQTAQYFSNMKG